MGNIKIKKRPDRTIVTRKLKKNEQINNIEFDLLRKKEIPSLLIPELVEKITGRSLAFEVVDLIPLADFLRSGITFGEFLDITGELSETIRRCESHGIRKGNLELSAEHIFYDHMRRELSILYWPLISMEAYADERSFLRELAERVILSPEEPEGIRDYMAFFDDRQKFDLFRFEEMLKQCKKYGEKQTYYSTERMHEELKDEWAGEKIESETDEELEKTVVMSSAYLHREYGNSDVFFLNFPFWIGRSDICDFIIKESVVSQKHAFIIMQHGKYYLCDNNSTNGTRKNGDRIDPKEAVLLSEGDCIQIGREKLIFHDNS